MKKYNVGIFWFVRKKFLSVIQQREDSELSAVTGKVDSDYSHYDTWDVFGGAFPYADFATYPRGRVMYDLNNGRYIVYSDRCIPDRFIDEYARQNGLVPYVIERDEHYRCDYCLLN